MRIYRLEVQRHHASVLITVSAEKVVSIMLLFLTNIHCTVVLTYEITRIARGHLRLADIRSCYY
jgi:hypothetical protein